MMTDRTTPPPLSNFGDLSLNIQATKQLDNGIECYVVNGGDDEMNRVHIYLHGGTMMEQKPATAILTALLLTTGTQSMSPEQLAEQFDYYGVRKSADSYDYWTEVVMTSLNANFGNTMKLLCDCIINPSFPNEELELMKRRFASQLPIMQQRVKYLASVRMKKLYYGNENPLGHEATVEEILDITREDLINFHRRHFMPSACKVIIAGKVDDNVWNTLNATLGQWHNDAATPSSPQWSVAPSPTMFDIVDKPGALQSAVRMRIAAVKRDHPDYLPLRVLVMAFGGYFGSRLMMNIREDKGYTYGIHASLLGIENDGCIDIGCETATQHTWDVIKEVKHEMKRLREELIPLQELETVKQHMLSSLAKTHDTPYNIASYITSTLLFGVYPGYHNDQLACLHSITPQQLRELAVRYLQDNNLRTVIAGDKTELNKM